jgi:hypothetical protein
MILKRVEDLEFMYSELNKLYEITQTIPRENGDGSKYRIAICFYQKGSEGYYVKFIGDRPFRLENHEAFWSLLKFGQTVLDASFALEQEVGETEI